MPIPYFANEKLKETRREADLRRKTRHQEKDLMAMHDEFLLDELPEGKIKQKHRPNS